MKWLCKLKQVCEDANVELMEDTIQYHFLMEHSELNLKKKTEMKQLLILKRPPNVDVSMAQLG